MLITIFMLDIYIVLPLLLWVLFLYVGLRWAKVADISKTKLLQALVITTVIQLILYIATCFLMIPGNAIAALSALGLLLASLLVPPAVIKWVFKLTFLRSLQAWLPTILMPVIFIPFLIFIVRPYLFEAFIEQANSMAPTILGIHREEKCETCGSLAFGSAPHPEYFSSKRLICEENCHVSEPPDDDRNFNPTNNNIKIFGGDRFITTKFLKPKRWDVVTFRSPSNPETLFVKRLVGMPGEEITIHDGFAYADGKKLIPPASISGLRYENIPMWDRTDPDGREREMWGSPENPAKLADDEYFMLGDFSRQSADSRLWEKGAPGHPPYAVPKSYMIGVVTHIYWPLERWRSFR